MASFRPSYEDGDVEGAHRLHLNVERWRVPETWFDPSQAGADCAGLGEVIEGVLRGFNAGDRDRLVQVNKLLDFILPARLEDWILTIVYLLRTFSSRADRRYCPTYRPDYCP